MMEENAPERTSLSEDHDMEPNTVWQENDYSTLNEDEMQIFPNDPPKKMLYATFLVRFPYLACVAFFIIPVRSFFKRKKNTNIFYLHCYFIIQKKIVLSIVGLAGYPIVIDYGIDSFQAR